MLPHLCFRETPLETVQRMDGAEKAKAISKALAMIKERIAEGVERNQLDYWLYKTKL